MSSVSLVITSCNRLELLERTINSFESNNTFPLAERIIVDDSGSEKCHNVLRDKYSDRFRLILNQRPIGQIRSIDRAYGKVSSEYIYHCEDDWEFLRPSFIEEELAILKSHPKILQVWLREDLICQHERYESIQPESVSGTLCLRVRIDVDSFADPSQSRGFSLNPGLRRVKDYLEAGSYAALGHEREIEHFYFERGFRAVALIDPVTRHIGWGQTVSDPSCSPPLMKRLLIKLFPRLEKVAFRKYLWPLFR